MIRSIRLGTRKSPLALIQAACVKDRLTHLGYTVDIIPFTTSGDRLKDQHLENFGGKVLFTKEIEEALSQGQLDIAVHSVKDVEIHNPYHLILAGTLEREDPRDGFLSAMNVPLKDMPQGAIIGTASPRRASQVLEHHPHITIQHFRGNVQTRLTKLHNHHVHGTFLAIAGLNRLNLSHHVTHVMDIKDMVPAVGQGAIGLQCHKDNHAMHDLIQHISHEKTFQAIQIERAFLEGFEGSCTTPVGGYCDGVKLYVWASCGKTCHFKRETYTIDDSQKATAMAYAVGCTFLKWRHSCPCQG